MSGARLAGRATTTSSGTAQPTAECPTPAKRRYISQERAMLAMVGMPYCDKLIAYDCRCGYWHTANRKSRRQPRTTRKRPKRVLQAESAFIGWVRSEAEDAAWRGRAGRNDHKVLKALLDRADKATDRTVAGSVRELSIAAGVGLKGTHSALARLIAAGWIVKKRNRRTNATYALAYELRVPDHFERVAYGNTCTSRTEVYAARTVSLRNSEMQYIKATDDVALYCGDGRRLAYNHADGRTAADIAKAAEIHPSTAGRNLRYLEQGGMVRRDSDGLWWQTGKTIAAYTEDLACAGKGARRAAEYREQRENYRRLVTENAVHQGREVPEPPPSLTYGEAALMKECEWLANASGRTPSLNTSAFRMGRLVAAGELDEDTVRMRLLAVAKAIGLPTAKSERTIRQGLNAGIREGARA